jgi:hypothetical protein
MRVAMRWPARDEARSRAATRRAEKRNLQALIILIIAARIPRRAQSCARPRAKARRRVALTGPSRGI